MLGQSPQTTEILRLGTVSFPPTAFADFLNVFPHSALNS